MIDDIWKIKQRKLNHKLNEIMDKIDDFLHK